MFNKTGNDYKMDMNLKLTFNGRGNGSNRTAAESEENICCILSHTYSSTTQQDEIRYHSESLMRFTYRSGFPALTPYASYTSDAGWGCMIRVAQMLIGQGMSRHLLGKNWRLPRHLSDRRASKEYCNILRWFVDGIGPQYIYSLHHLVQAGMAYDKLPGEWYGPTTAALVLRDITKLHRKKYRGPLEVYVTSGTTLYRTDVMNLFKSKSAQLLENCLRNSTDENDDQEIDNDGYKDEDDAQSRFRPPEKRLFTEYSPNSNTSTAQISASENYITSDCEDKSENTKYPTEEALYPSEESLCPPVSCATNSRKPGSNKLSKLRLHESLHDPLLNPPPDVDEEWPASVIVIIPLRLGVDNLNPEYIPEIKRFFHNPHCLGILGGRVNHAIYFVGYQGEMLLGLDPHVTLPTQSLADPFPSDTYMDEVHVRNLEKLSFNSLDPSLAIAFYFHNKHEFKKFCDDYEASLKAKQPAGSVKVPLFDIQYAPPVLDYGGHGDGHDGKGWGSGSDQEDEDDADDDYVLV